MAINPIVNRNPVQLTYRQLGSVLVGAIVIGAIQISLIDRAFFSINIEALKVAAQTELSMAKMVIEQCEVFSTITLTNRSNGSREIGCVFDLAYAKKLDSMRDRVRKLKQKRKKEKAA